MRIVTAMKIWKAFITLTLMLLMPSSQGAETIIDPSVISITSWQEFHGDSDSLSLEKLSHSNQWSSIKDSQVSVQKGQNGLFPLPLRKVKWLKADFIVGWHHKNTSLALSLGPLRVKADVYVNGVRLVSKADPNVRSKTQLFLLPKRKIWYSFLTFQKRNEILIKVTSDKLPLVFDRSALHIGNYDLLALQAKDKDTIIKIEQGSMIALLLSFCLFSFFLRALGFRERENLLFFNYVISVATLILIDSLLIHARIADFLDAISVEIVLECFSILILIALLEPTQKLAHKTILLAIGNGLALFPLMIDGRDSLSSQWLVIFIECMNLAMVLEAFWRNLRRRKRDDVHFTTYLQFIFLLVGLISHAFWGIQYSPVNQLQAMLFLIAIIMLFNVARRFKLMSSALLALSNRLVSIREKERKRLTRDIHDGVGQGLSTLKLLINLNLNKLDPELGNMLKQEVNSTSDTLKSVIRNLKPIEVESGSPTKALVSLAQHCCKLSNIRLHTLYQDDTHLSKERAYQVYRIGQEAINNAIKHSDAQDITLSLRCSEHSYSMEIIDNGKGLSSDFSDSSYGLSSMHERSMIIGARLSIENREQGGAIVSLEVPIRD